MNVHVRSRMLDAIARAAVRRVGRSLPLSLLLLAGTVSGSAAQGAGSAGAQVLQFNAGSRAAALSGAYTAAHSDAEALFYNPAGAANLGWAGALSYETYVEQISVASAAGVLPVGRFSLGLGIVLLDGGEIAEIEPDPDFGGMTGRPTGRTISASETAVRVTAASTFLDQRLRVGVSAGLVSTSVGSDQLSAPLFDFGAQFDLPVATLGLALRNLGGGLTGDGSAELPTELRLGASTGLLRSGRFSVALQADLLRRITEESTGFLVGVEAGLVPAGSDLQLLARAGYSGAEGEGGLAPLKFGGGLVAGPLALDYTFQHLDLLGGVHRFGLRWNGLR